MMMIMGMAAGDDDADLVAAGDGHDELEALGGEGGGAQFQVHGAHRTREVIAEVAAPQEKKDCYPSRTSSRRPASAQRHTGRLGHGRQRDGT
jgi:hypothetical protein